MQRQAVPFSSRKDFTAQLQRCLTLADTSLQLFDADFAFWNLGSPQADAQLRRFLAGKGRLQLVAHDNRFLERDNPRFLRLLQDFRHAIECRLSGKHLRQLSDSFCIADGRHIVRRFHQDHWRGEAVFGGPADTQTCLQRFDTIWHEALPGLRATIAAL